MLQMLWSFSNVAETLINVADVLVSQDLGEFALLHLCVELIAVFYAI